MTGKRCFNSWGMPELNTVALGTRELRRSRRVLEGHRRRVSETVVVVAIQVTRGLRGPEWRPFWIVRFNPAA